MGYTLPTNQFSMAELDKIQQPSVAALLHALGYSKKTPRAMAFGPDDDGGIGIRHLLPEQGTGSSLLLLGYLRADSFSGKYARTALNWLQLWAGQPFSILEDTKTLLSYLPANWFTVLRSFYSLATFTLTSTIYTKYKHFGKMIQSLWQQQQSCTSPRLLWS